MVAGEPAELEDWLQLAASALALAILVVAVLAYRRRPTTRTLLVTIAFGLFAARGLFNVADFVLAEDVVDVLESLGVVLEVGFLVVITAAFLKA